MVPQTPSDRAGFCAGGGYAGIRGLQMPTKRPASSVCDAQTNTCLAFAGDSTWTVQKVLDQGADLFTASPDNYNGYTVVVVPVRLAFWFKCPPAPGG